MLIDQAVMFSIKLVKPEQFQDLKVFPSVSCGLRPRSSGFNVAINFVNRIHSAAGQGQGL